MNMDYDGQTVSIGLIASNIEEMKEYIDAFAQRGIQTHVETEGGSAINHFTQQAYPVILVNPFLEPGEDYSDWIFKKMRRQENT